VHIKTYSDAAALLADAQEALEKNEAENTIVLSILFRLASGSKIGNAPPYLATVWDDSRLLLVAVMTPPRPLLLFCEAEEWKAAIETLAENVSGSGLTLPGVIGRSALASAFASMWERRANVRSKIHVNEREYVLREVLFKGSASGFLRPATAAEFDLVLQWAFSFHSDVRMPRPRAEVEEVIRSRLDARDIYLWMDNGEPVSIAGRMGSTPHGARIGLVYTPLGLRGRGYATACVAHLSQLLLDSGKEFCTLSTDLANPISNSIYQKIGYRPVLDFCQYEFQAPSI